MKNRFSSLDLAAAVFELKSLVGMRVNQVYDIDNKTFLFKVANPTEKAVLLIESGIRIHRTTYDWPKRSAPSGFSMKLRKHLKNKRIEKIDQLGTDRIVHIQFGTGEVAHSIIVEFFNRGNLILIDHSMTILNLLIPHTENDATRFAVGEKYSFDRARDNSCPPDVDKLKNLLSSSSKPDTIQRTLLPHFEFGPHLLEHTLICAGFSKNSRYGSDVKEEDLEKLVIELRRAEEILLMASTELSKGYIIKKSEERVDQEPLITFLEFHPYLFKQQEDKLYSEYPTFNAAVDDFFSHSEGQKIELKALQMERDVITKIEKVKENQKFRIQDLIAKQENDRVNAELIMYNSDLVENVICALRSLIAAQMSWSDISASVREAQRTREPIGLAVKELKLDINHVTLNLCDPYCEPGHQTYSKVDIDIGLSAHANAKMYFNSKKSAALKEKKTMESQNKAIKSAEKKAKSMLKDIKTYTSINKSRKTHWFEKFYWFISSENYLVIGGRDQQQNELVVKRYMGPGDVYVHADIHGASNIVIKNPSGKPIPHKTLTEAGTMAVCYSTGWDSKILCSAWWVYHHQVSKTAPTGEYLQTGSFMVRGHKNYLLPAQLALGFGFLFRIDESCIDSHVGERVVKTATDDVFEEDVEMIHELTDNEQEETLSLSDTVSSPLKEAPNEDVTPAEVDQSMSTLSLADVTDVSSVGINDAQLNDELPEPELYSPSPEKKADQGPKNKAKESDPKKPPALKRGQKSKLKKIKEKYKDQDEEEKELRMSILKSAGEKKEPKKAKKNAKLTPKLPKMPTQPAKQQPKKTDYGEEDIEEIQLAKTDLDALQVLTGQPLPEDELLYALPVIAPYNTLMPYKYKIKLIPGTTKRGKGAKIAVESFVRSKECSPREKDLIKSVDDQLLSRNFPGKVKLFSNVQKKK